MTGANWTLRWRKPWDRVLDKADPKQPRWFSGGETGRFFVEQGER